MAMQTSISLRIAVFCGSKSGSDPRFRQEAYLLGRQLAQRGCSLVYGGGRAGLMGIIADAALAHGAQVTGIIPRFLNTLERKHEHLSEQIEVNSMHERKTLLYERCDAAIAMPGGVGTLDELFELLTWNQLTLHHKKAALLNVNGFYDHLYRHILHMRQQEFLHETFSDPLLIGSTAKEVLDLLTA